MEDGGALLKTGLSTEDVALDAGRNDQCRTERSTEDVALDAGLETRWKTERSFLESEISTLFFVWSL